MNDSNSSSQTDQTRVALELKRRFSRSLIWKLQNNFFKAKSILAWSEDIVPFYITNNAFIAEAYAKVVYGWLCDWHSAGKLDLNQTVYILELGTGSGRLAFLFQRFFFAILEQSSLRQISVQYVMTDYVEQTVAFWQAHPSLQPFVRAGHLQFAQFDAEDSERPITLLPSGTVLTSDSIKNPMIVLANYFFDSIPADLFHIRTGQVYESLASIYSKQEELDLADPEILSRITIEYEDNPVPITDYYNDPEFDALLINYCSRLDDTTILFPKTGLEVIRTFRKLSGGRLMIIVGDKGHDRELDLLKRRSPGMAVHGSFSLTVNYHALEAYIQQRSGHVLRAAHRYASLNINLLLMGDSISYDDTRLAYHDSIEQWGPDELFTLRPIVESHVDDLTAEQILSYLRLNRWDPHVFVICFPTLHKRLDDPKVERLFPDIREAALLTWSLYYHMGETHDVPFCVGVILFRIGSYEDAIRLFELSLALFGQDASTFFNLATCYFRLGRRDQALTYVKQTLDLAPDFGPAREMQRHIESDTSQ